jgi:hypothetical protein
MTGRLYNGCMSSVPPGLDLAEILYTCGDLPIPQARMQVGDALWHVVAQLTSKKIAGLWVILGEGMRQLEDWEVAAIIRSRAQYSGEPTLADEELVLRGAENLPEAYQDFMTWFDEQLGRGE